MINKTLITCILFFAAITAGVAGEKPNPEAWIQMARDGVD